MRPARRIRAALLSALLAPRTRALRRSLAEMRRRITGRNHSVHAFLELDDPYSYLLSGYVVELAACYDIDVHPHLVQSLGGPFRPEAAMFAEYAVRDCRRMAAGLGLPFLDKGNVPPVESRRAVIDTLAALTDPVDRFEELVRSLECYWRGDAEGIARIVDDGRRRGDGRSLLESNQRLLARLGHYNAATLYCAGEWYWGVDRLHYLTERLDAILTPPPTHEHRARLDSLLEAPAYSLPVTPPTAAKTLPELEYFHSFRSPYSYLAVRRVLAIADAFGLRLRIRPVLPMIARGMQVPMPKLRYIGHDASREAERHGVPFGRFADPAGAGVERCMAVFAYARDEHRERDFLVNVGEAIWARGVDVATDAGMRKVTGRTGLFWPGAREAMASEAWRVEAEANREALYEAGCWGVPVLRIGDFAVWGQDRDWLLVRHLEELCDSGEGILI